MSEIPESLVRETFAVLEQCGACAAKDRRRCPCPAHTRLREIYAGLTGEQPLELLERTKPELKP